jgi:glycosyltransferase involved in cell wall biosynthesis
MAIQELHSPTASVSVLPPRRERLAIVSTRNKLCGIAAYTEALERHLADIFDITVFDLDQYLLHNQHPRVRAIANRHIKEICRELATFDVVSLQLEYGTLGRADKDIYRRFSWLAAAAPRLSVTFHSLGRPLRFPFLDFFKAAMTLKWQTAVEMKLAHARANKIAFSIPKLLRRLQRRKPVSVIVHNRRDRADACHLHGLQRVFDHPLSFLSSGEIDAIRNQTSRRRFAALDALPADAVCIGVFGFLGNYKGFETVVRALHHLTDNHHLLIFGGTHPSDIRAHAPVHPYIASLLETANADTTLYDQLKGQERTGLTLDIESRLPDLFGAHPRDLSRRLHFMGAPENQDFLAGMAVCDLVVFPYLEVGQSASGPIAQAVELGCRILASRTHTFLEFAAYHPETIEFFDIGNHLELAGRIASRRQYPARRMQPRFNIETNKAVYLAANSAPSGMAPNFRRRLRPMRRAVGDR